VALIRFNPLKRVPWFVPADVVHWAQAAGLPDTVFSPLDVTTSVTSTSNVLAEAPVVVKITSPVYVPGGSEPVRTETATVAGVEPEAGVTESQLQPFACDEPVAANADTVKGCADPSLAARRTFCERAVEGPKLREAGVADSVCGGAVVTFNVTLTVCGLFVAVGAVTSTVPKYCPVARPAGLAVTVTPAGVLAPGGAADSQAPPEAVVTLVVNALAAPLPVT